jgi:hypothetical protein
VCQWNMLTDYDLNGRISVINAVCCMLYVMKISLRSKQNPDGPVSSDHLDIGDFRIAWRVIIGQKRRLQVAPGQI